MEDLNKNKTMFFIGILVSILIVIIIISSIIISRRQPPAPIPTPTPTLLPTSTIPSISPTPTLNYKSVDPTEIMKIQTQADTNWGNDYNNTIKKYPWLNDMPISTDKYFVYFDESKKKFGGDIYVKDEAESLKTEIIEILKAKNIDLDQYPIEWQIR